MLRPLSNFQHFTTLVAIVAVCCLWLTGFVLKILDAIWPVAALALVVFIVCAMLAASTHVLALSLRSFRPAPTPIEIWQPPDAVQRALHTYAHEADSAPQAVTDPEEHRAQWDAGLTRFMAVGNPNHFSYRQMKGYVTRPAWDTYTGLATARPYCILIRDKLGTRYGPGWYYSKFRMAMLHGELSLLYPNTPPPAVRWQRHTDHSTPAQAAQVAHLLKAS